MAAPATGSPYKLFVQLVICLYPRPNYRFIDTERDVFANHVTYDNKVEFEFC